MVHKDGTVLALDLGLCVGATIAFAVAAFYVRAVNRSGAIAGGLLCFLIAGGGGFAALSGLVTVFVLAYLSTKIGYKHKVRLGTAEKTEGRNARQVFANLSVAAGSAVLYFFSGSEFFCFALVASLSEAAADTVSSEIGQLSDSRPRLITTWNQVAAGSDGGVTILGTASGLAAAILVTGVCAAAGLIAWRYVGVPIFAALCGTLVDSFLGAWFERRKMLTNNSVNFLGTLVAALIAIAL